MTSRDFLWLPLTKPLHCRFFFFDACLFVCFLLVGVCFIVYLSSQRSLLRYWSASEPQTKISVFTNQFVGKNKLNKIRLFCLFSFLWFYSVDMAFFASTPPVFCFKVLFCVVVVINTYFDYTMKKCTFQLIDNYDQIIRFGSVSLFMTYLPSWVI